MKKFKDLITLIKSDRSNERKNDRIKRKLEELIKKTDKLDIKLVEIFSQYSKDNILQFQKILNILVDELDENDDIDSLNLLVNELLEETSYFVENNIVNNDDYKMRFQIHDILVKIMNFIDSGYLSIENGEIKCLDLKLSLEDPCFKQIIASSLTKGCDGLIDKEGKFYFAYHEHEYMVQYLTAMSTDLTSSLRVHQSHYNKNFALSSFFHYYSSGADNAVFKNDENLVLSTKQIQTLKDILDLYELDKEKIINVFNFSTNLGFDFLSTSIYSGANKFDYYVAMENIDKLSKVFEDVDFSYFRSKIRERAIYLNIADSIIDD